jgi:7,8-dihydroneopterin aldolase/epimerase/oxygenase
MAPAGPAADPGTDRPADRIEIRGLRVVGIHGVLPEERERAQPFLLDLDVRLDAAPAGRSDRLEDTVDYGAVVELAAGVVAGPRFALVEALADAVARAVLGLDHRVAAVAVSVHKLRPPLPFDVASAGARVVRRRGAPSGAAATPPAVAPAPPATAAPPAPTPPTATPPGAGGG